MKRKLPLVVSLAALLLFLAVQVFMIDSTWRLKEEILLMRYRNLSREGLSLLISKKKSYGFEKAMDVTDKFAGYLISEEVSKLETSYDTAALGRVALKETYSIMRKNEMLTSFLRSYMKNAGYDSEFESIIAIAKLELITPSGNL
ncbi:MAG: hypothetical protein ACM3NP_12170, partial [Actinomycetota bacterium]